MSVSPTQRIAFRGMSASSAQEPAALEGRAPVLVGIGQRQHQVVAVTLFQLKIRSAEGEPRWQLDMQRTENSV